MGNAANHEGRGTRREALHGLSTAHHIAKWFHRTFADPQFIAGPFQPPPNPVDAESELKDELEFLRDDVARYQQDLALSKGEQNRLEGIREKLDSEAKEYPQELADRKTELFAAEQQHETEREDLEQQLEKLREEAKTLTPEGLQSLLDRSHAAARFVGLGASEYLPIAQMRIVGPNWSACCRAPELLVETCYTGGVSACCSVCGHEYAFTRDDFKKLNLWISCPNCRVHMNPKKRVLQNNSWVELVVLLRSAVEPLGTQNNKACFVFWAFRSWSGSVVLSSAVAIRCARG